MKLVKKIFVVMMIVSLAACKSDDDGAAQFLLTIDNLVGNHDITLFESLEEDTFIINNVPVVSTITTIGDTFQVTLKLNADQTYLLAGQFRITETTIVGNDTLIDTEILVLNETGTFTINANNLTITLTDGLGGDSQTWDVALFNETQMNLTFQETGNLENEGTFVYNEEIRFIRQ